MQAALFVRVCCLTEGENKINRQQKHGKEKQETRREADVYITQSAQPKPRISSKKSTHRTLLSSSHPPKNGILMKHPPLIDLDAHEEVHKSQSRPSHLASRNPCLSSVPAGFLHTQRDTRPASGGRHPQAEGLGLKTGCRFCLFGFVAGVYGGVGFFWCWYCCC